MFCDSWLWCARFLISQVALPTHSRLNPSTVTYIYRHSIEPALLESDSDYIDNIRHCTLKTSQLANAIFLSTLIIMNDLTFYAVTYDFKIKNYHNNAIIYVILENTTYRTHVPANGHVWGSWIAGNIIYIICYVNCQIWHRNHNPKKMLREIST